MHRPSTVSRCKSIQNAAAIAPLLDFLTPVVSSHCNTKHPFLSQSSQAREFDNVQAFFFNALSHVGRCKQNASAEQNAPGKKPFLLYDTRIILRTGSRPASYTRHHTSLAGFSQKRGISSHVSSVRSATRTSRGGSKTSPKSEKEPNPWEFFEPNTLDFAQKSRLPLAFFHDVESMNKIVAQQAAAPNPEPSAQDKGTLEQQLVLIESIRKLEEKLEKAKRDLSSKLKTQSYSDKTDVPDKSKRKPIKLSKDDYKNLVDLYFYTHRSRFDPESADSSPTPSFIEDYSFKLSEDFAPPQAFARFYDGDNYESPLKEIEKSLSQRKLREIVVFQVFIDLLSDDHSSNSALFEAYKKLPQPGVAFLPTGTVRLFLQRMSTPWTKSEKAMLRYLSLIDDMQEAGLPITRAEWASAIYLAGRSFGVVSEQDMARGFQIWRQMEQEAGVESHHVTFNILFDLAVRSNKYSVAQRILKEMHARGLRLNRLGRVSVIYYHGLRKDGDAVRKAYRDFVDAGEIVDTLVLNCVIAALLNAGEPSAAEQIYERMKSLYSQLHVTENEDGRRVYYKRYPGPDDATIDRELASNSLNRILLNAARLRHVLPEHHKDLQDIMPLVPDHRTFRAMISYHANETGNLDRIVVLMNEMTEIFGLPLQSINFHLLFKGFSLHGGTTDPHAKWSIKRLKMVWEACYTAIKERNTYKRSLLELSQQELPTVKEVDLARNKAQSRNRESQAVQTSAGKTYKRLSTWNDFVLDLALFPRERRKHIERIHSELFDEADETPSPRRSPLTGQESYYPLGERGFDIEEGEYVLPPPTITIDPKRSKEDTTYDLPYERDISEATDSTPASHHFESPFFRGSDNSHAHASRDRTNTGGSHRDSQTDDFEPAGTQDRGEQPPEAPWTPHQVRATRTLVCWVIRAYARCTGSRKEVEKVYNEIRRVWRPHDEMERDAVLRVLTRCLHNCDVYGPPL